MNSRLTPHWAPIALPPEGEGTSGAATIIISPLGVPFGSYWRNASTLTGRST